MQQYNLKPIIGILSLQGDYSLHHEILKSKNIKTVYVNSLDNLHNTDALIIPGGESTVMTKLLIDTGLHREIKKYSKSKNIFGTCAGAIMMSSKCDDIKIKQLNIMDIEVKRNAWGRQINSFTDNIKLLFDKEFEYLTTFIRAPKLKVLSNNLKVIGWYHNEPVLIRNSLHLVSSFHPEMGSSSIVHDYFLSMINNRISINNKSKINNNYILK